jgi:hypothetical protein
VIPPATRRGAARFKGSKDTPADLPLLGSKGDVWQVSDDGDGNPALYSWRVNVAGWVKVADPDASGLTIPVTVAHGGTGATTALGARSNLGLVIGTNVQAFDVQLAALAALTPVADDLPYFTAVGAAATTQLSAFIRTVLDDANAAAARSTLGLIIGTDVQAFDAQLAALAGTTPVADDLPYFTAPATMATTQLSAFARTLIDDATAVAARTTLGVTASPLTTKGDVYTRSATVDARQAVGSDYSILSALDGAPNGIAWLKPESLLPTDSTHAFYEIVNRAANTTSVLGIGTFGTLLGTTSTAVQDTTGHYWRRGSAAALNSDAGWQDSVQVIDLDTTYWVEMVFRPNTALTELRIWIGLFSATPMASNDPTLHGIGINYDTAAHGDGFWRAWSNDNVGGGTITATTSTIVGGGRYRLVMDTSTAGTVKFYINGTLVATHTTNLPVTSQKMLRNIATRTLAAATAKNIDLTRVYGRGL